MKVVVSVKGRFHAFDLAKQLQNRGILHKLNTTYPKYIVAKWGLEKSNISSNILLEYLNRFGRRFTPKNTKRLINNFVQIVQAKSNYKYLDQADVLITWSGSSLEALIKAKDKKIITILERGSSHYNYQMQVLTEEYGKLGKSFGPDYKTWKRELLEYELADYISVPSTYVKNSFLKQGVPVSKLLLNPYGVDLSSFKQIPKTDNIFRVVYAGGFTFRKGVHYLLQAFYELDLPNSELIHLGSIQEESAGIIKKFKRDNIKFLGHQPQNELYKHYSQGSVFVMMSIEEGLAMVQPQAMACGLPLICSKNTGGEDLLTNDGEEGFVIAIRDVESLKQKLFYLYNNPDKCIEMGAMAKERVSFGFTWKDYGDRYIDNLKIITTRTD